MTQAFVVMAYDAFDSWNVVAVFATHEEAEAYARKVDPSPRLEAEIVGPVPVGLAAMAALP